MTKKSIYKQHYEDTGEIEMNLLEFFEWCKEKVPEERLKEARINIYSESHSYYESSSCVMRISSLKEETDEEYSQRLAIEKTLKKEQAKRSREQTKKNKELRRKQYEQLKKEFENEK